MEGFILKLPNLGKGISFSNDWVVFLFAIILFATGVLMCFLGYKYLREMITWCAGVGLGFCVYQMAQTMSDNRVVLMCVFVIATLAGICITYGMSSLWELAVEKFGWSQGLKKSLYIWANGIGMMVIGMVGYIMVYRNIMVCGIVMVLVGVLGLWYSYKGTKASRTFYTYDDLLNLKPSKEEEGHA